jgi:serine/threonine protein phosphatase PrpC
LFVHFVGFLAGFVINRRVMGQLAISRAFGDFDFKDATRCAAPLVIATPETKTVNLLTPAAELFASNRFGSAAPVSFAVLACDGLFDVLTDREVCDFIAHRLNDGSSVQAIAEVC